MMTQVEREIHSLPLSEKAAIAATLTQAAMLRVTKEQPDIGSGEMSDAANYSYDIFCKLLEKMLYD